MRNQMINNNIQINTSQNNSQKNVGTAIDDTRMPKNIIYTGVAGTGKTHRLQQLAKQYSNLIQTVDNTTVLTTLVQSLTLREVMCLVFWQNKQMGIELLTIAEISQHEFFLAKAQVNNRQDSIKKIARELLVKYSNDAHETLTTEPFCYFCRSADNMHVDAHNLDIKSNNDILNESGVNSITYWYMHDDVSVIELALKNTFDDYCSNKKIGGTHCRYEFVSFHQSYGYDEFVEGIRPVIDETTGQMRYTIVDGVFLTLCQRARADPRNRYAMFIDEINRANVAQVFGELMSLIEPSKRSRQANQLTMSLAYSGRKFSVPSNVDMYATMNTQDFSLVSLDQAFRRRFQFIELLPDAENLKEIYDISENTVSLQRLLTGLNQRICQNIGSNYQLGHAYFINIKSVLQLVEVMVRQVLPQLLMNCQQQPALLVDILQLNSVPWLVDDHQSDNDIHSQFSNQQHGSMSVNLMINPVLSAHLCKIDSLSFDNGIDQLSADDIDSCVLDLVSADANIANEDVQPFFMADAFIALYNV